MKDWKGWLVLVLLVMTVMLQALIVSRQSGDPFGTRVVLCRGIMLNQDNTARGDETILEKCADAGVFPEGEEP